MATGRKRKAQGAGRGADSADFETRALNAAVALIAESGWRKLTLADVAHKVGAPLARVRATFPGREAVLEAFFLDIDRRTAANDAQATADSTRDRLFDLLMRRFDALLPHREAIKALIKDLPLDPDMAAWCAWRLLRSLAWTLEAAGLPGRGLRSRIRVKGLFVVYLNALRVWLDDDSADLSPTMAALDKGLRAAETLAGALAKGFPGTGPLAKGGPRGDR